MIEADESTGELVRDYEELGSMHRAARDEARRYREFFDAAPTALVVTDPFLKIVEANAAAARLFEVELRFLIGKPLTIYVDGASRRAFRSWHGGRRGTRPEPARFRFHRRGGVAFDAVVGVVNGPGELYWTITDLTEQAQVEARLWELNEELERRVDEQLAETRALVSQLPVGVLVLGEDGDAVWLNERAQQILSGETWGPGRLEVCDAHGRPLPEAERPWRRALAGETVRNARVAMEHAGVLTILEVTAAPIGEHGAVVVLDDVTAQATVEHADEEFVQNAAHQLRNPVTAIASSVAALELGAQHDEAERARFLSHISRESERMSRVVEALLTLEGLQRRTARALVEVVPLRPFLRRAAERGSGESGRVEIECGDRLAFVGDADLLGQAVENVVENAVRHSGGGTVVIRARVEGTDVHVEVTDSGAGVPPETRDRVFDRFFRGEVSGRRGAGLGLAIAAAATVATGGRLALCPQREGEGATFRFTLPAAELL